MKALRGSAEEKALLNATPSNWTSKRRRSTFCERRSGITEAQRDKANSELEKMMEELQIEASV